MRNIFIIIFLLCLIGYGCGIGKFGQKIDDATKSIDVRVEELNAMYKDIKITYQGKVKSYETIKEFIYGEDGSTDIWKYIVANETQLVEVLEQLDKDLIKTHNKLVKMDSQLNEKYITWQDYKKSIQKITDSMQKIDFALHSINTAVRLKLNASKGFGN